MNKEGRYFDGAKGVLRTTEGLLEVAILTVIYYFVWRFGYDVGAENGLFPPYLGKGKYVLAGVYAVVLLVLFFNFDGFKFGYMKLTELVLSQWIALFISNFITYWQLCLIANVMISPLPVLMVMAADMAVSFCMCYLYTKLYHVIYIPKNMAMIFGRDDAVTLKFKMDTRSDKYHISKLIAEDEGFENICRQIMDYDAVIINDVSSQLRNDVLKFCYKNEIRTYVAPKISDIVVRGAMEINLFDTPLLLVKGRGLSSPQRALKRCFDVLLCLLAMVVGLPIMLLVALAIKIEDGGPVFYKQKRVTLDGKVFEILKFRSMIVDAEKNGMSVPATEHDPRITRVGRFIRATRIDELPQLLNILKGDMSIVGPRPERVEHMEAYSRAIPEFPFRLKVKGGLTGYAQIYGKYNTSPYDKLRLDLLYIENYSFMLDIKLVLMTLRIMLTRESTEGFDQRDKLEQMKQEMLAEMRDDKTDDESGQE